MAKTYIIAEQIFFAAFPQRRCTARFSYIFCFFPKHIQFQNRLNLENTSTYSAIEYSLGKLWEN